MKHAICPACGSICSKYGKTTSGSQRWICKNCSITFTQKIDNSSKQLQIFLNWLFSKEAQKEMRYTLGQTEVYWIRIKENRITDGTLEVIEERALNAACELIRVAAMAYKARR